MMAGKVMETEEQNRIRFQVELEFVQCLANPNYIHSSLVSCMKQGSKRDLQVSKHSILHFPTNFCYILEWQDSLCFVSITVTPVLAQRGYLKEQPFINYIKYLQYWREPEYARYLKYPMCLHFLELLQHEAFRRECVSAQVCKFMDDQAILLWQHYTRRRTRTLQPPDAPAPPAPPAPPQGPARQQS